MSFKSLLSLLLLICLSYGLVEAKNIKPMPMMHNAQGVCKTKALCQTNPMCKCWCSESCGPRTKKPGDEPVWVENDPDKIYCYCQPWDLKEYYNNCKYGKKNPRYKK